MEKRGENFLEETLRFGRVMDLLRAEKVRGDFERVVVSDTSITIERQVNDIIDWILSKNSKLWKVINFSFEFSDENAGSYGLSVSTQHT